MSYELSETSIQMDMNGDGYVGDDRDQAGMPGDQETVGGVDGNQEL